MYSVKTTLFCTKSVLVLLFMVVIYLYSVFCNQISNFIDYAALSKRFQQCSLFISNFKKKNLYLWFHKKQKSLSNN